MNTKEKTYTKQQHQLIAELCATYGLEPDQIIFFNDDPRPHFDREATAVLIHALTDAVGIEDDLVPSHLDDTICVKYRITFPDGSFAGSTGAANIRELKNGEPMSRQEIQSLATSRASRSALTNRGIDLLKLHHQRLHRNVAEMPVKSTRAKLISEAHVLGEEKGLICGNDKTKWQAELYNNFSVINSNELNDTQLGEFVAYLKTIAPQSALLAA